MLRKRGFLIPWLASSLVMCGLSYLWHGLALNDLQELRMHVALYVGLSLIVYLVIGLAITLLVHQAVAMEWVSLRRAFPFFSALLGSGVGVLVFLLVYLFGMRFTDTGAVHMVIDAAWQVLEQGIGGLLVSLGIIYDLHRRFMESENAQ